MLPTPLLIFARPHGHGHAPHGAAPYTHASPIHPYLYVGILSGVTNRPKRDAIRAACFKSTYEPAGIRGVFYVNAPDLGGEDVRRKIQGVQAPAMDVNASHALAHESEEHGDIVLGMARDNYMDIVTKVVQLFRDGLAAGATWIIKHDDDTCIRPRYLLSLLYRLHAERTALSAAGWREYYVGWAQFRGTEYKEMEGPDGTVAPYMSGPCYALSAGLARTIFETDRTHTVLWQRYGTSSEDAMMGKWIQYAAEKHGIRVKFVADEDIMCGQHYDPTGASHNRSQGDVLTTRSECRGTRDAEGRRRPRAQPRALDSER